jgi:hypothetical protein
MEKKLLFTGRNNASWPFRNNKKTQKDERLFANRIIPSSNYVGIFKFKRNLFVKKSVIAVTKSALKRLNETKSKDSCKTWAANAGPQAKNTSQILFEGLGI